MVMNSYRVLFLFSVWEIVLQFQVITLLCRGFLVVSFLFQHLEYFLPLSCGCKVFAENSALSLRVLTYM